MKQLLVSIIIPCYNTSLYIEKTLNSILNQTYRNFECIIINDCSSDNTLSVIQNTLKKFNDTRFSIYTNYENKGLSDTRNIGISKANGDFIFFCDGDDFLPQHTINTLISHFTGSEDIIVGKVSLIKDNKIISHLPHPNREKRFSNYNNDVLLEHINNGLAPVAVNKLYKTSFLKKYNFKFLSGIYHEDELWFFETIYYARNILFIPETTYLYIIDNQNSITKQKNDKNLIGSLTVLETIYNLYYKNNRENNLIAYYLVHLKKVIISIAIKKNNYTKKGISRLEKTFLSKNPYLYKEERLSFLNRIYFNYLNKISLLPFNLMKKYFFLPPINSLRKYFILIKFLTK